MRFQMNQNVALSRYAGLGDEAWKQDFSLKTRYKNWFSEYVKNGKPVPFRTDFLIHLEPIEEGETRIEVIEYEPEVTVGANFHLCERHLVPGVTPDTRPVAPTTKDRREMLKPWYASWSVSRLRGDLALRCCGDKAERKYA